MTNSPVYTKRESVPKRPTSNGGASDSGTQKPKKGKPISKSELENILIEIQTKIDQGASTVAENQIVGVLEKFSLNATERAQLHQFLAFVLEMKGKYADALSTLQIYEEESVVDDLDDQNKLTVLTHLANAYNNRGDYPKAIAILNSVLEQIAVDKSSELLGRVYIAFSRVYRKLAEYPIARDFAQKALINFRDVGNWRGMAESNEFMGVFFQQEGLLEKAVEHLQQAIKIVGDRQAPFILGKAYSELSGTFWFLRRPKDGIECLEKSIQFYEKTEHKVHAALGYNNLGLNLLQIGEWKRAEEMIHRALNLAIETNHAHEAGILDTLGDLLLMKGDTSQAQEKFEEAIVIAEKRKAEWYVVQASQNLARCLLVRGKFAEAVEQAEKTILRCEKGGQKHYLDLARLSLTESFLKLNQVEKCEEQLMIFESDLELKDFFVLGNIQRIRGLLSIINRDDDLATHHFSRSLTLFETAEDLYHTALANLELGRITGKTQPEKSYRYLKKASDIFAKLGVSELYEATQQEIDKVENAEPIAKSAVAVNSQLLTLRLAEATATRELLFRELISILNQESKAKKLAIVQPNPESRLIPFLIDGFTPAEGTDIAVNIQNESSLNTLETFAKRKNINIFPLRTPSSPIAYLVMAPRSSATLVDGTSIKMLLRVVELGMDLCSLREKEKLKLTDAENIVGNSDNSLSGFIHTSPAMAALVDEIHKIRSSDVTVLVTGESGTGKEVVSNAIHKMSQRKDKVFVPFNCTAIPKELAEGHLFGYKKGAYTGAVQDSVGVIRSADGGTLFLDEIGDLPLDVQPKLLRFLQEGEIQPLGEKSPIKVDVRVIAATNVGLEQRVAEGKFREDLFYRLNVIRLRVPPLRERRSEIAPLVNYYVDYYSDKFNKKNLSVSAQAMDLLMVCEWEGNVRQLCNEVQRFVVRASDGEQILPENISVELKRTAAPIAFSETENRVNRNVNFSSFGFENLSGTMEEAVTELETRMIIQSMHQHSGNISRVSRELGLTRRGLYLKLERYRIEKG
jgi:hydrogenase-4 transcriptional activator